MIDSRLAVIIDLSATHDNDIWGPQKVNFWESS